MTEARTAVGSIARHRPGSATARGPGRRGGHRHQEPAAATVDVDALGIGNRPLHVNRHRLPRAERRRPAHQVAGVPLRHLGRARHNGLTADLPREVLGRDITIAVHQDEERLLRFVFHHQGFDHDVLADAKAHADDTAVRRRSSYR